MKSKGKTLKRLLLNCFIIKEFFYSFYNIKFYYCLTVNFRNYSFFILKRWLAPQTMRIIEICQCIFFNLTFSPNRYDIRNSFFKEK